MILSLNRFVDGFSIRFESKTTERIFRLPIPEIAKIVRRHSIN